MQSKIIFFCYAYMVGIVLAKVLGVDPAYLPSLHWATGLVGFAVAGYLLRSLLNRKPLPAATAILLLIVPSLLLGYTRYTSENTVEDTRLGVITLKDGATSYVPEVTLPDTARLRFRSLLTLESDLRLVVKGELDARVPVLSKKGLPQIDEHGRWQFKLVTVQQQSDVITLSKDAPLTRDYIVSQPFTRVTKIELLGGPDNAAVAVYRVSNHVASFVRPGRNSAPATILGRISGDPQVFGFKTVVPITPLYLQYRADGPFYRIEGGEIRATMKPGMRGYEDFACSEAYGSDVMVHGSISSPRPAANPGGFDPREFLKNHNVYGSINLFEPPGGPSPMSIVKAPGGEARKGIPLVEFSLDLRDKMLLVFKQSMPYPQSAFLGAVTLGLRYGLQNTTYPWEGFGFRKASDMAGDEPANLIAEEFRHAGVNHVLAVSGLHVTIITVMFIGIFSLMRISRKVYVPAIILILIIFAIITGARPSTLRAVIMNSLFLLTWAYLNQGLRASALLGVPVAAFLILLQNPMMIVDASFTLSFGAILSLALLTDPFYTILNRLKGNEFLAFIIVTVTATAVGMYKWALLISPSFWMPFVLFAITLFFFAGVLKRKGIHLIGELGYSDIPVSAGAFVAAQFGIQIGMMLPLSAYYFSRWPFAGAYANLIAIPLIGVVVQLGVIAGLVGFIPAIGLPIALVLNAANWVFSSFFLWISHVCTELFPYPFVSRPSLGFLLSYYIWCAAFIWHKPLWEGLRQWCDAKGPKGLKGPKGAMAILGVGLALTLIPIGMKSEERDGKLNISILSVGYGSSILVETPGGSTVLIDGGFVEEVRGRHNAAVRTVLPYLSYRGIRNLDHLILTSTRPERSAGLVDILKQCRVENLTLPRGMIGANKFTDGIETELAARSPSMLNRWSGWDVKAREAEVGQTLVVEKHNGRDLRIDIVAVGEETDSTALRISYGEFALLLPSDLSYEETVNLTASYGVEQLRADVMIIPSHGTELPEGYAYALKDVVLQEFDRALTPLIEKVQPEWAVFEFGNPRPVLGRTSRDALKAFENVFGQVSAKLGKERTLNTDADMAVLISSDGESYQLSTMAQHHRDAGTAEGEVADLEIGF